MMEKEGEKQRESWGETVNKQRDRKLQGGRRETDGPEESVG